MNKLLLFSLVFFSLSQTQAQTPPAWSRHQAKNDNFETAKGVARQSFPKEFELYDLNINLLRETLFAGNGTSKKATIISLPNTEGQLEDFEMYEASNFEADLQAQFPEIRAYSGKGITDKYATLKLSISPAGIQTMVFRTDSAAEYMEPYSADSKVYAVFKSNRRKGDVPFTCTTVDKKLANDLVGKTNSLAKSNAGKLLTLRLAMSCTGEYATYHGGTKPLVLAAFNNTMTRVNGVYEKDLAVHMNLIANTLNVIYLNASSDPYGSNDANYNSEIQKNLTTVIGAINYDIGHLFSAVGGAAGSGDAGCTGCVCDIDKGSAYTTRSVPMGDDFDVDFVCHEMGHQFGGNHTFSYKESNSVNLEVGSGVTIMGYTGITNVDVAPHSLAVFHAGSLAQIQASLATKTCPVVTSLAGSNATPVANAGSNYSIPEQTPFELRGSATDANAADALTYNWEQYDDATTVSETASVANPTKTNGPNWITWNSSASPNRLCPKLATFMTNSQFTTAVGTNDTTPIKIEYLSSVAKTMTFRLTVRDNSPYVAATKAGQTAFDDMTVSVLNNGTPFTVSSQNTTGISYLALSTQTVTWVVAGTNILPYNAANVKIMLSTDNGATWGYTLLASTPNDGSQTVTIPSGITSANCRIRVEAIDNIFLNVNTTKFTINPSLGTANTEFQDFGLFPNPNKGQFTLKFTSSTSNDIQVNVHDMRGRLVYDKSFSNKIAFNQNINLNKVEAGIYLVSVVDGAKKTVKRIVIE